MGAKLGHSPIKLETSKVDEQGVHEGCYLLKVNLRRATTPLPSPPHRNVPQTVLFGSSGLLTLERCKSTRYGQLAETVFGTRYGEEGNSLPGNTEHWPTCPIDH